MASAGQSIGIVAGRMAAVAAMIVSVLAFMPAPATSQTAMPFPRCTTVTESSLSDTIPDAGEVLLSDGGPCSDWTSLGTSGVFQVPSDRDLMTLFDTFNDVAPIGTGGIGSNDGVFWELYTVDDLAGTIDGVNPNNSGYASAVDSRIFFQLSMVAPFALRAPVQPGSLVAIRGTWARDPGAVLCSDYPTFYSVDGLGRMSSFASTTDSSLVQLAMTLRPEDLISLTPRPDEACYQNPDTEAWSVLSIHYSVDPNPVDPDPVDPDPVDPGPVDPDPQPDQPKVKGKKPKDGQIDYVSLGDSFSSGEGGGDYTGGRCHRSKNSIAKLLERRLANELLVVVKLKQKACSGDTIRDMLNDLPKKADYSVDLVTFTIGINNVGWSDLLSACYLIDCGTAEILLLVAGIGPQLRDIMINEVYPELLAAYPNAEIFQFAYPHLVPEHPAPENCNWLNDREHQVLSIGSNGLSASLADAAASTPGITFVEGTLTALAGREWCTENPEFNPVEPRGSDLPFGIIDETDSDRERAHPTASGYSRLSWPVYDSILEAFS